MENEQLMRELITLFLQINPEPSDQQFHALAMACGIDHETLEAVSYQMLGEETQGEVYASDEGDDAPGEEDLSDAQDVLDGDYDPNVTKTDDLMLNDGLPAGEDSTALLQDSTLNDGVSSGDTGAGLADQSLLYSDGLAPMKLGASARLALYLKK
ncbi:MAG: hypothetical protein ABSA33_05075 [Candidatus Micrarchaeaceae archaeon]